jgi:hypothetical protein
LLIGRSGFAGSSLGALTGGLDCAGVRLTTSLAIADAGALSVLQLDGSTHRIDAQRDTAGAVAVGFSAGPAVVVGGALKAVHSALVETFSATTVALDVGVQWQARDWLRLGLAQLNAGRGFRFGESRVALPTSWRAGLAIGQPGDLIGLADLDYRLADGQVTSMAGVEWDPLPRLALRAGETVADTSPRLVPTVGFGLRVGSWFLDYAIEFVSSDFVPPQQLSLRWTPAGG